MQTENLEEMVKGYNDGLDETIIVPEGDDITPENYSIEDGQGFNLYENMEQPEPLKQELEKQNPPAPVMNMPIIKSNFQAKTEEELIKYTTFLYGHMESSIVMTYWHIGQGINSFYQKEYGKDKLQRISDETGINRDTLTKACKFARQFTEEQVAILLKGRFAIPWNHISQNLSVEPASFIEAYNDSESTTQFNINIIKFKKVGETWGRKKSAVSEVPQSQIQTNIDRVDIQESVDPEVVIDAEVETIETFNGDDSDLYKEIDMLKMELEAKDRRIFELKEISDQVDSRNMELGCVISEVKQGLRELFELMGNRSDIDEVMDKINDIWKIVSEVLPKT